MSCHIHERFAKKTYWDIKSKHHQSLKIVDTETYWGKYAPQVQCFDSKNCCKPQHCRGCLMTAKQNKRKNY